MEEFESHDMSWLHSHENNVTDASGIRFDLFVRSLGAVQGSHGRQASILDRVDRLDRTDVVDTTRVTVWGDSVCVSECCADNDTVRAIRDRIDVFRSWARGNGHRAIGFREREVTSSITEESFDVIDLPTISLAVYVDSRLDGVFPVAVEGEEWTIERYLDWFERSRTPAGSLLVADA